MMWKTTFRWRACAAIASVCLLAGATDALACKPEPLSMNAQGADICYGKEVWQEPTLGGRWLDQDFNFYRVPSTVPVPLIVWAHPNGMSKGLPPTSPTYQALVVPALQAGFSFASIEFRHPVVNEDLQNSRKSPGIPQYDIARALQFIRANADALGIDKRNIFIVAQSRGTLGVWTALQDDMKKPNSSEPVLRESTRVNAVYAVKGQTTYDGVEFADLFIVKSDREAFVADFQSQYSNEDQFGSAIASVSAGIDPDPPVRLIYDAPVIPRKLTIAEMALQDSIHYPNFGPALCNAYVVAFGNSARCSYDADLRYKDDPIAAYAGYVQFFQAHLQP